MDEDWRNIFGILMCMEICHGAGAGICHAAPSTCSSLLIRLQVSWEVFSVFSMQDVLNCIVPIIKNFFFCSNSVYL